MRHFVKTFINDIVIKSRFFSDHIIHFRSIFKIFSKLNISIKLIKVFLNYSNVVLLRQRIDALKLSTTKEKLKVIANLKFSNIFKNLKHYLKFTKYIRNHIYYYFAIVKSLQNLKTILLKTVSVNSKRRQFINKVKISSTQKEFFFFRNFTECIKQINYAVSFCRFKYFMNRSWHIKEIRHKRHHFLFKKQRSHRKKKMIIKNANTVNYVFKSSAHHRRVKLLINEIKNIWTDMNNQESETFDTKFRASCNCTNRSSNYRRHLWTNVNHSY